MHTEISKLFQNYYIVDGIQNICVKGKRPVWPNNQFDITESTSYLIFDAFY